MKVNIDNNNLVIGYMAIISDKPYRAVSNNYDEKTAIEIDIPSIDLIHLGYSKVVNGVFYENREEYLQAKQKEELKQSYIEEMQDIKTWFNTYYTIHEQKYNRLIALGNEYSSELNALYILAEEKRTRYNELEVLLEN